MVYVGSGIDPDEGWWIVAARSYSDQWGGNNDSSVPRSDVSYLTNEPSLVKSSGETWINVGRPLGGKITDTDWSSVDWPTEQVAAGQAAQQQALRCLESPNAKTP